MTRLVISSRDAERIAKSFDDMIGDKGLKAIRRRAVNEIGSGLRKDTRAIAPGLYGASLAALMMQGQAAGPGSDDPEYRLRMATSVPVARLRARSRKAKLPGRPTPAHPRHPGARPADYLQLGEARGARGSPCYPPGRLSREASAASARAPEPPLPMRAPADMPSWRGSASAPPATCPRRSRGKSERRSPSGDDTAAPSASARPWRAS